MRAAISAKLNVVFYLVYTFQLECSEMWESFHDKINDVMPQKKFVNH